MTKRKHLQHELDDLRNQANQYTQQSTTQLQNIAQPTTAQLEGLNLGPAPIAPVAPTAPENLADPDTISRDIERSNEAQHFKNVVYRNDPARYQQWLQQRVQADPRYAQYNDYQNQLRDYNTKQGVYQFAQADYQGRANQARQQLYTSAAQNLNPNITQDPRLQQAQTNALSNLEQIGQQGFTRQDQDALNSAMFQSGLQERSEREAQLQQARARGMGGSGLEFASALEAQQGAANRNYNTAAQLGLQARQRALDAIVASGQLGQSMQGQEYQRQGLQYGQQAQRSAALDAFKQWATGNQQGAAQQNFQNAFGTATGQSQALQGAAGLSYTGAGQVQGQMANTQEMVGNIFGSITNSASRLLKPPGAGGSASGGG